MPLGSTSTATPGPAILRIGAAATSLTDESTTGQSAQWKPLSSRLNTGVA